MAELKGGYIRAIAIDVGVTAAVVYEYISYWCENNKDADHYRDGYYWTYNSVRTFQEYLPEFTEKQIRTALITLEEKGYIKTGCYNRLGYDRTKWYTAIKDTELLLKDKAKQTAPKGESNCPAGKTDLPYRAKQTALEGEPIPYNTQYNTQYITHKSNARADAPSAPVEKSSQNTTKIQPKYNRFTKPNVDEVKQYCKEHQYGIDCQNFIDYYESNGWKVGRNAMKDWKAAVRTWERRDLEDCRKKGKPRMKNDEWDGSDWTAGLR